MTLLQPGEAAPLHLRALSVTAKDAAAALANSGAQPLSVQQLAGLAIRAADFDAAVKKVQPSVRREGFATTPDVTWNDVGSLAEVRCAVSRGDRDRSCLSLLNASAESSLLLSGAHFPKSQD